MQFVGYLPDEFKEKVSIYRIDEYTRRKTDIASDVVCWIEPDNSSSGNQIIVGADGVVRKHNLYTMHLETPIPDIQEADYVKRTEKGGDTLRVFSDRPYGDDVMQIILREEGVL